MTIYEISNDYNAFLEMMDSDEFDPQTIKDTLESIEGEFEDKADNYAKIMKNFEVEIAGLKAEEDRLKSRRKKLEDNISRMKQVLFDNMKMTGKVKFKTGLFSFTIAKNGGKIPVIVDVPTSTLADEFVIIEEKPNLEAIGKYLEANPKCQFAHFGERGESLRIK